MGRTLLVTNDFPPRTGGIQNFVHALAVRQPEDSLVVYASSWRGAAEFDAAQPFEVVRADTTVLLPTPRTRREAVALAVERGCDTAWYGAMAPLGLLAPALRAAGVTRQVAQTHGHEAGWAALPGTRGLLRRIGRHVDVVTYLGEHFRTRLGSAIGPRGARLEHLAPGVDTTKFRPELVTGEGAAIRRELGLADRPVVVCVSRLVPRKGQDTLIRALPALRRRVPDAALLIVSGGPDRDRLRKLARDTGVTDHVVFTGSVPWEALPHYYAAGDVFAMPCRSRRGGLEVEGLGIVYLEASATGLPVVAGDSGGAPDAVRDGETGFVVGGRDVPALADRLATLLTDRALAERMGKAGRAWVESDWQWDTIAARMHTLLTGV
ncbi:glycosyltransferase family 4 protein [Actinocatenispora rupis]|uniref:Glycosyl transferase family 1 n=1 Tax=Actinocatenispora rupis TaxID=519421 RepID=A0A8J3J7M3_9ACTN|nr:glycosyltransferase family 4 protein [Actinocatenispora rupis]GID13487.1 glycosyl transferase family 1 [Actinocatenispora rupis]